MGTLKKFMIYLLLFLAFFGFTEFMVYAAMKDNYIDIKECEIKSEAPQIIVTEAKAARGHGYVKGNVINNTDVTLPLKYLKINFYDKDDIYLGSEYKELKYFIQKEKINFDIEYKYQNVTKIKLYIVDEIPQTNRHNYFENIEDEQLKIALPIAGALMLYTILP